MKAGDLQVYKMRLCGVFWCADDDGAPAPTKQGNIGDTRQRTHKILHKISQL